MKKEKIINLILSLVLILAITAGGVWYYHRLTRAFAVTDQISEADTAQSQASAQPDRTEQKTEQSSAELFRSRLDMILRYMDAYYYDEVDMDKLYDAMLHAAVSSLGDPYSVYYSPEEYAELMESASGVYSGIGATITQDMTTMSMTIVTPYTNSPAFNSGLRSGDEIIGVDGESVIGQQLNDVVLRIRGVEGTDVNITILREGEEITFKVTRARINVIYVSHRMLEDNIGYIYVSEFEQTTAQQFREAVDDLEAQGMKGLVVDIRNNPGGLYNIVCDMLDRILPNGELLVYTEDKTGYKAYQYAKEEDKLDIPIAVIVNGNSASASEIFAGALQDHGKATIVGTQSFGKGIVQSVIPIDAEYAGVKLTTSRYFTPNGVCIHGIGITPDVVVDLDEDLKKINIELREHDNQIEAAAEEVKKHLPLAR